MAKAAIEMKLTGEFPPNSPCTGDSSCGVPGRLSNSNLPYAAGTTSSGEYDDLLVVVEDLVASGSLVLDLLDVARLNPQGVAFTPVNIIAFHMLCLPHSISEELGHLRVAQNAGDMPWTGFLSTTGATDDAGFVLRQGMHVMAAGLAVGDMPVGAGNCRLLITETTTTLDTQLQAMFLARRQ